MPGLSHVGLFALALVLLIAYGWAMKRWGRAAERAEWLKATREAQEEVQGAVERARRDPVRVDRDWLKGAKSGTPPKGKAP